jgi:hypothetical protein
MGQARGASSLGHDLTITIQRRSMNKQCDKWIEVYWSICWYSTPGIARRLEMAIGPVSDGG